jgi:hypothetical protein
VLDNAGGHESDDSFKEIHYSEDKKEKSDKAIARALYPREA